MPAPAATANPHHSILCPRTSSSCDLDHGKNERQDHPSTGNCEGRTPNASRHRYGYTTGVVIVEIFLALENLVVLSQSEGASCLYHNTHQLQVVLCLQVMDSEKMHLGKGKVVETRYCGNNTHAVVIQSLMSSFQRRCPNQCHRVSALL